MLEDAFIIEGGKPLKGQVQLSGAKNAALKIIIAATMLDQEVRLEHVPFIKDVDELLNLISGLGGEARRLDNRQVVVDGRGIKKNQVELLYGSKIRTSFMFFAPLLYKFRTAFIPNPGGCRLGARSIDLVIEAMRRLGLQVEYNSATGYYQAQMKSRPSGSYTFTKPSHTATELLIMLSVFARGQVTIRNAAQEPEIDDLILFFNQSGAKINRQGNDITIEGVTKLSRQKPFTVMSDRIEAVTYAVLGLATKGDVILHPIKESTIKAFVEKLRQTGAGIEQQDEVTWRFFYKQPLKSVNIETAPHPGFMTDWQPVWAVLMTQASGVSIIHERIYENRFSYVNELKKLGADIDFVELPVDNPANYYHFNYDAQKSYNQVIKVRGPKTLHNGALKIEDLRAGATLAIAALTAQGESVVNEVSHLERGYEDFVLKVKKLGGVIKKV